MIKLLEGDLLDGDEKYILHQVNCIGVMGSGVAKAIRAKYPEVYWGYRGHLHEVRDLSKPRVLGDCLGEIYVYKAPDGKTIINGFGQVTFGTNGTRHTNYEAVYKYLQATKNEILKEPDSKTMTLAIPYKLGSDRGGADWRIIYQMIKSIFEYSIIHVTIYRLSTQ